MRHVLIEGPHSVRVADAPDPRPPGPGGAVVSVEAASICGSDLHFYDGDIPVGGGFPVGHELVGTVVETGPEVRRFSTGDRVLASAVTGCGGCRGCATGDPVRCVHGPQVFGSGVLGGAQATLVGVPAADFQLLAVPEYLDDEAALLLTDNLPTGWAGAERAEVVPGGTVLLLGLGAVGLCALRSALALGAGTVLAADPVAGRRERAGVFGALPLEGPTVETVLEATGGQGADSVIDTVATDTSLNDALSCVRAGGTVSVLGVHDPEPFPLPILAALIRSTTLRMTTAPVQKTWGPLLGMVRGGRLGTDGIFTHRFGLEEAPAAYAAAAARTPECVKVMFLT